LLNYLCIPQLIPNKDLKQYTDIPHEGKMKLMRKSDTWKIREEKKIKPGAG
jgi:hypothetical protein